VLLYIEEHMLPNPLIRIQYHKLPYYHPPRSSPPPPPSFRTNGGKHKITLKEPTGLIRSARKWYQWIGQVRICLAIGFLFLNFDLSFSKRVQNSIVLHAQIYLTTKMAWRNFSLDSRTLNKISIAACQPPNLLVIRKIWA
jgi:hypothetical protein